MSELTKWDSFHVIVGSASGALIGLQFVGGMTSYIVNGGSTSSGNRPSGQGGRVFRRGKTDVWRPMN